MAHLDLAGLDPAGAPAAERPIARTWRPSVWQVACALLIAAFVVSFFPLRFTATATIAFDVGTQPPASAVRGVAQVISSREMAYDAVRLLPPEDAARLAARGLAALGLGAGGRTEADARAVTLRAAWRLMEYLQVEPAQGGRELVVSVSAATPGLAARAANAYVTAFLALDATTRASRDAEDAPQLPLLRRGTAGVAQFMPDAPRPLALGAMGLAALLLALGGLRRRPMPAVSGPVDRAVLPVELQGAHRITWLGAPEGGGLDEEEAVERLMAEVGPPGGTCHLVLLTSEDRPEASAACAVALARRLSDEAGVALVALDGETESLSALVSDPRAPGVSELLFGVAGFGETIHRDAHSRAHVIPPGRDARGGPSVVGADRLALVLEALRKTYDYVVVAAPNLGAARGGRRLAALDPLVVCLSADDAPSTTAVEAFDALADKRFSRIVMLCMASGKPAAEAEPEPSLDVPAGWTTDDVDIPFRFAGAA